ncbi:MAG: TonB-dependent siderophore receptor [Nitrococcus sp.]|nr:TonB-dependent siderophore receptor [Nitrococcus sp.]
MQLRAIVAAVGLALTANMAQADELERNIERRAPEPRGPAANKPAPTGNAVKLPSLTVTASPQTSGYRIDSSFGATKTDTPLIETPVSVQIVPRQVIDDRQYTSLQGALENVSGVVATPSLGLGNRFLIRGFSQSRHYRDGLRSQGLTTYGTATIERIEVIKGPASVLYGRIQPGGLVNIVTKKPLPLPYHSLELQGGSFGYWRVVADTTGPIDADRNWMYRLVGAWQKYDTFKDFGQDDRWLIAPSLTWRPSKATDFRVSVEYFRRDFQAVFGTPVIGDRPVRLPRERNLGDPNSPVDKITRLQVGTEFNHRFNADWMLRHRFLFGRLNYEDAWVNPTPAFGDALQADGRTLNRNIFGQTSNSRNYSTNLELLGQIHLGPTEHQILAGVAYFQNWSEYITHGDWINPNPALAIDIFNPWPSYGIDPALFEATLATSVFPENHSVFKNHNYGVYIQDQVTFWNDRLHILLGGRYDWAQTGRGRGTNEDEAEADVPERKDQGFSPRVAVLYQFRPNLSGYASWSRSFGANNGVSASGETFDPQRGEQYELGFKAELFDQRLFANLAVYYLTKTNLLTPDRSTPDLNDSIAVGEQRSQGVEIDITGQVTDQFSLIAGYAYTDAEVTRDNSGREGNRLPQVPKHALSFWGRYDFAAPSALSGLTLGFGGVAVDDRPGDLANSFKLPGYVRLDAMAAYRFYFGDSVLTAQINVRNLADTYYFASTDPFLDANPRQGVAVGAPRSFIGAIKLEF